MKRQEADRRLNVNALAAGFLGFDPALVYWMAIRREGDKADAASV
jgi:hypothetical protein